MLPILWSNFGKLTGQPISTIKNATKKYFIDFTKPYKSQYYYVSRDLLQPLWDLACIILPLVLSPLIILIALIAICWLTFGSFEGDHAGPAVYYCLLLVLWCLFAVLTLPIIGAINLIMTPLTYLKIFIRELITIFVPANRIKQSPSLFKSCTKYRKDLLLHPGHPSVQLEKKILTKFTERQNKGQKTDVVIEGTDGSRRRDAESICNAVLSLI